MSRDNLNIMSVNPRLLLRSDPGLAEALACYAASQNDVQTLQAFLEAGLDPAVAIRSIRQEGGREQSLSPWFKAVESNAVDCVRLMMERSGASVSTLMEMRPEGCTAMEVALLSNAKAVLALWQEKGVDLRKQANLAMDVGARLGSDHPLGVAAQFGDEHTVRWLLREGADPTLRTHTEFGPSSQGASWPVVLEHYLAWGDCAQVLSERLKSDPQCGERCQESFSWSALRFCSNIGEDKKFESGKEELEFRPFATNGRAYFERYSGKSGLAVVHRVFPETALSVPANWCPMTPIACAVVAESAQTLEVFTQHFGREVVETHAQKTLNFLRDVAAKVRVYSEEEDWESNQGPAQIERAVSACERWLLGVHPTPSGSKNLARPAAEGGPEGTKPEATGGGGAPSRRGVRL